MSITDEDRAELQAEHRELERDFAALDTRLERLRLRIQDATGAELSRPVAVDPNALAAIEGALRALLAEVRALRER